MDVPFLKQVSLELNHRMIADAMSALQTLVYLRAGPNDRFWCDSLPVSVCRERPPTRVGLSANIEKRYRELVSFQDGIPLP
jgi:hypothetical protein